MPTDLARWARDQAYDPRWHVASDGWETEEGWVHIDTRFLGFDPREEQTGLPALFDTYANFVPRDGEEETLAQRAYRNRADALSGHEQLVSWLTTGGQGGERNDGKRT